MKIRRKGCPAEVVDVSELHCDGNEKYRWWCERDGVVSYYAETHWEPVPTEEWEDVTGQVDTYSVGVGIPGAYGLIARYSLNGYRFRKIWVTEQMENGEHHHWAFIIERRKEC